MPELPEVETVVRDLRPLLVGRRFTAVAPGRQRLRRPWLKTWGALLVGQRVDAVERRGKWIILELDDGQRLVVHLGMTGQLTVVPSEEPAATHTHLVFSLDHGGRRLRFRDIRRFGSVTRFADASRLEAFFQASGLGPEPFEVGRAYWRERLATTERCLKAVLLDQQVVAGVGNIYADESLFEARLHPGRLACRVEAEEAERLRRAIVKVLTRAIHSHGSTIRDYVGGSGLAGCYQDKFRAYGRTGLPCPRCQVPIERVRLAGRSTHFCPRCQSKVSGPLARAAR